MRTDQVSRRRSARLALLAAGALGFGVVLGCATSAPGQPRMQAALDQLQAARAELERAEADKGGHRVEAMRLVERAIDEVRAGIEFARR